jgi:hypothetical protein
MLDKVKLEDLAFDVKLLGADLVAEKSGVMQSRVSRFIKNQQVVTMTELQKIKAAVQELKETK